MTSNDKNSCVLRIGAMLSVATLAACAGTPFEYRSQREIPAGPGLLTGERGAFAIGEAGRKAAASADAASASPTGANANRDQEFAEFEEFRAYRRARSEQTPEYREFQEWLQWRRYRDSRPNRTGQGK